MSERITWANIYTEFRKTYPNLRKHALHWRPYDVGQIILYLDDGFTMVYDYDLKKGFMLDERWKE